MSAAPGSILTAFADLLKNVYGTGIQNQFHNEVTTYNQFKKSSRTPRGNGYVFGVGKANPQGIGSRADGQPLPDPLPGKYDNATIVPKYHYGVLRTSGPAIEAAKGDMATFLDGLEGEVKNIYDGMVVDLNRQCWGDGGGAMAISTAVATPATGSTYNITCDNDVGTRYLQEGMVLDVYATGGALDVTASAQRISAINPVTNVVTMEAISQTYRANHPLAAITSTAAATGTIPVGSVLVRSGVRDAAYSTADTPVEMIGLEGIYDDGTLRDSFQNINADNNPFWRANMMKNAGTNRELTIDLMLKAIDLTRLRSGKRSGIIRTGLGQRRKYANLLLPDVRFTPGVLKGGYETLTFAGGDGTCQIVVDPVARPNAMYFEVEGAIQKYEMTALGWGDLDGSQMHRRQGYDQWEQFLRIFTNLGTEQRNCLTKLAELTEPSTY
jgi:hypothetical protein